MAVYVDNAKNRFGKMIMCHMIADSPEELHIMADKLKLPLEYYQDDANIPHYDLSLMMRKKAIKYGAKEVTTREIIKTQRRKNES